MRRAEGLRDAPGTARVAGLPAEQVDGEEAARRQYFARKFNSEFGERHDLEMIGLLVSGGVGRHVRKHAVSAAAEHRFQAVRSVRVVEIHHGELDAGDRLDVEEIDADEDLVAIEESLKARFDDFLSEIDEM